MAYLLSGEITFKIGDEATVGGLDTLPSCQTVCCTRERTPALNPSACGPLVYRLATEPCGPHSGAMHRAIPVSADPAAPAGPVHPREKPASRRGRAKSRETRTLHWRGVGSNLWFGNSRMLRKTGLLRGISVRRSKDLDGFFRQGRL